MSTQTITFKFTNLIYRFIIFITQNGFGIMGNSNTQSHTHYILYTTHRQVLSEAIININLSTNIHPVELSYINLPINEPLNYKFGKILDRRNGYIDLM